MPDTNQEILQRLTDLETALDQRLNSLEVLFGVVVAATGKTRIDPAYLSLDQAAALSGKSKGAIQKLLQRQRDNPKGLRIRQIRGAVHRRDFENFLETLAQRKPGRGEQIRQAARG